MIRFLLTVSVLSFVIGCSAENPLCTDNYCITGEIFPKDELEAGQTFEVLPIDESALVAAIDAATVQDGTDVVRHPKVTKTTPEEWKTLMDEQGDIPVMELITAPEILRVQVADRTPESCVSVNDEEIDGVRYTIHRVTWIRITNTVVAKFILDPGYTTRKITGIESSMTEGETCGIKATEIVANYSVAPSFEGPAKTVSHSHRLVIDMTVGGDRRLYVSPTTWSKD